MLYIFCDFKMWIAWLAHSLIDP